MRQVSRRHALIGAAAAFSLTLATVGCSSEDENVLEVWSLEDEVLNPPLEQTMQEFNESSESDVQLELVTFENDAYKERLQVAMGSNEHPDVFFSWGGGNLGQYVDAGQVYDMTEDLDANAEFRDSFLPSVMGAVEFDGSTYGVPMLGVQPVSFFYNAQVFEEANAEPPETFDELLDLIDTFQDEDITPIVLPGADSWTLLMWVSYLVDRIGGAEVYEAISSGDEGAWEDPAVIETMETVQDLVDRGAFGSNFQSITWDGGDATALLGEGEAAMILMGPWMMQDAQTNAPDLFEAGDLRWFPFPELQDGAGEPDNVVGPLTNYFSIHAESEHSDLAMEWLVEHIASDEYISSLIENGAVPPVEGIEEQLADTEQGEFNTWLYELTEEAPNFTPAWDQDLDPSVAETMLTNFSLVFEGQMSPEEFAEAMEAA